MFLVANLSVVVGVTTIGVDGGVGALSSLSMLADVRSLVRLHRIRPRTPGLRCRTMVGWYRCFLASCVLGRHESDFYQSFNATRHDERLPHEEPNDLEDCRQRSLAK
jgi:hypothetical protein